MEAKNQVIYLSEAKPFEAAYIAVREKEGRVLSDEVVKNLPHLEPTHRLFSEWNLRIKTCDRFAEYLQNKNSVGKVLDLGCGNGWFSNWMLQHGAESVAAIDMNQAELEQAAACFHEDNLTFYHADIFSTEIPNAPFDFITVNACAQYFPDFPALLERLKKMLADNGEIHILDTPFYTAKELPSARQRSKNYYRDMGTEDMADFYHHRCWDELQNVKHEILYKPSSMQRKLGRLMGRTDSPFPWICVPSGQCH